MPDELEQAELVKLYKKRASKTQLVTSPLRFSTQSTKPYAAIIQKRLAKGLENKLWETLYEFREANSSVQPLCTYIYIYIYICIC